MFWSLVFWAGLSLAQKVTSSKNGKLSIVRKLKLIAKMLPTTLLEPKLSQINPSNLKTSNTDKPRATEDILV